MTTQDQLKTIVEKLIETMESNTTGAWIKPWNATFPMNYSSKRAYNGINIWILWAIAQERNYPTNYWLSFQQIQGLKGRINKSEKSTPVFFFKTMNIKEIDEKSGEEVEKTIPLLKSYNVFNIAQTDLTVEELSDTATIPTVEEFINNTGIEIRQDSFAYYHPKAHYIGMPHKDTFKSTEGYYSTLLHELAHSTGKAMERDMSGKFGSTSYAQEELVAETTKTFLATYLKIEDTQSDHFQQSAAYLKSWLKGSSPKELWKVFSQTQKAFDYLLSLQNQEEKAA
ncbi:MAG: zincin-like metallopeptidase domain-containing protein [Sulfuricurvum sp.]|nr:zincin-like metallopeptidase domain-containing protein [Sulfuricurvum sp.]